MASKTVIVKRPSSQVSQPGRGQLGSVLDLSSFAPGKRVELPEIDDRSLEFLASGYQYDNINAHRKDKDPKAVAKVAMRLIHQQLMHDGQHGLAQEIAKAAALNHVYGDVPDPPIQRFASLLHAKGVLQESQPNAASSSSAQPQPDDGVFQGLGERPAARNNDQPRNGDGDGDGAEGGGAFPRLKQFLTGSNPDSVKTMPPRESLNDEERRATAAINIIRAMQMRGPTYCPPGQLKAFLFLHHRRYTLFWSLLVVAHMFMIFVEPPPHQRKLPTSELRELGYYHFETRFFDVVASMWFVVHSFLSARVEGGLGELFRNPSRLTLLFVFSICLFVDMLVGFNPEAMRPFRPLRPMMIVLSSPSMTRSVQACLATLLPLLKTFALLFLVMVCYAMLALNLFSGHADDPDEDARNPFGAACLLASGNSHPFEHFGLAFVAMYTLGTADNHPAVIFPFYTCECTYTEFTCNSTVYEWDNDGNCVFRRVLTTLFQVTYVVMVLLGIGNVVLAICFVNYDAISKKALIDAAMRKRHSLVEAFYYIHQGGYIHQQEFLETTRVARKMNLGSGGNEEADAQNFRALDANDDQVLDLFEFFSIVEMMRTKIHMGQGKKPSAMYRKWKASTLRLKLIKFLELRVLGIPVVDAFVYLLIIGTAVMATGSSTKGETQDQWSNFVTFIFVVDFSAKSLAYGVRRYYAEPWNKFDCWVTLLTIGCFVGVKMVEKGYTAPEYKDAFNALSTVRTLRLVRLFSSLSKDFAKSITAIVAAVPATLNLIALIFFYFYFFACIGMDILSKYEISSIAWPGTNGYSQMDAFTSYPGDWTNFENALFSTLVLIVGNTWSSNMYNAMAVYGWEISWFFITFNFLGNYLMLNIVQSVFVFAFSTLLDEDALELTWENRLQHLNSKIMKTVKPKRISRRLDVDNLLLSQQEFKEAALQWQRQCPNDHVRQLLDELDRIYYEEKLSEQRNDLSNWDKFLQAQGGAKAGASKSPDPKAAPEQPNNKEARGNGVVDAPAVALSHEERMRANRRQMREQARNAVE